MRLRFTSDSIYKIALVLKTFLLSSEGWLKQLVSSKCDIWNHQSRWDEVWKEPWAKTEPQETPKFKYSWPLKNAGVKGHRAPHSQKSMYNFTVSPPYPGSAPVDSTNCRSCSTVVCIYWKNPCISGPGQFKPMLFMGRLQWAEEKEPMKIKKEQSEKHQENQENTVSQMTKEQF